jgi:hypothetical protein
MRPVGIIVALIVVILWFLGATLIAAPPSVVSMIVPGKLGLSSNVIDYVGILTFVVATILIALYTAYSKDRPEEKKGAQISNPPSPSGLLFRFA